MIVVKKSTLPQGTCWQRLRFTLLPLGRVALHKAKTIELIVAQTSMKLIGTIITTSQSPSPA